MAAISQLGFVPSTYLNNHWVRSAAYTVSALALGVLGALYGRGLVGLWVGGTSLIFLAHDITVTIREIRSAPEGNTTEKIKFLTRRIFMHGLVWGVLIGGFATTNTLRGFKHLFLSALTNDMADLIKAINTFAFVGGVLRPAYQFLISNCDRYFYSPDGSRTLGSRINPWIEALGEAVKINFAPLFERLSVDTGVLSFFPDRLQKDSIHLTNLSNLEITELMNRYPYILDIEYLATKLPKERFAEIVKLEMPSIDAARFSLDLLQLEREIPNLRQKTDRPSQQKLVYYVSILSQYENLLGWVASWKQRLPEKHKSIQEFISGINKLHDETSGFSARLANLRVSLDITSEDLEEHLRTEAGFSDADFKITAALFPQNESTVLNLHLQNRGLYTAKDLYRHGIFIVGENSSSLVIERLKKYLNTPQISSIAAFKAPRLNFIDWEAAAHKIQVVANYAFYYGTIFSLLSLQYYAFPIATTLGVAYGLLRSNRFHSLQKISQWETVPDYTGQTTADRCRFIWRQTSATLSAFSYGVFGTFFSGVYIADTLRHYAGPRVTLFKEQVSGWLSRVRIPTHAH